MAVSPSDMVKVSESEIMSTGSAEPVNTEEYTIDKEQPDVKITEPTDRAILENFSVVKGNASDPSSGVEKVEVQIAKDGWFVAIKDAEISFTRTETWHLAEGTEDWSFNVPEQLRAHAKTISHSFRFHGMGIAYKFPRNVKLFLRDS